LDEQQGTFTIQYPDTNTISGGPISFTVGPGQEASIVNVGNIDWSLDASGLRLTFGFNDRGCCTSSAAFNGPVVEFAAVEIASLRFVDSNIADFDPATRLHTDGHSIFVDIGGGLDLRGQRTIAVDVTANTVPEPSSLALLAFGLFVVFVMATRLESTE
jgi:hypothetical protein